MLMATIAFQAKAGDTNKRYRQGLLSHFTLNSPYFLKTAGLLSLGSLCLYLCSRLLKTKQPDKAKKENTSSQKASTR